MKSKFFLKDERGYTLVELMIVVVIISVMAFIAISKFGGLILKSKEAKTVANLGSLRSAISIYYSGNEGMYPNSLAALVIDGVYLSKIPKAYTSFHGNTDEFLNGS